MVSEKLPWTFGEFILKPLLQLANLYFCIKKQVARISVQRWEEALVAAATVQELSTSADVFLIRRQGSEL
eukprot:3744488-Amphidinium_carterae.1